MAREHAVARGLAVVRELAVARPPQDSWDAASLTQLLDDTRPDALINLAYYFDWFQAETVSETRLAAQEYAIERLAELCQHHSITLLQPSIASWPA